MKITFEIEETLKDGVAHPVPAAKMIPEWYKKMSTKWDQSKDHIFSEDSKLNINMTIKNCIPVRDCITAGYIIPMWIDMAYEVSQDQNIFYFHWQIKSPHIDISTHPKIQFEASPVAEKTGSNAMKFVCPWRFKTPPGYSTMFISPMYHGLEFEILPGIVDTDTYHTVNFPFTYSGPEGSHVIEKGYPLIQAIPFKRTDWEHEIVSADLKEWRKEDNKFFSRMRQQYLKIFYSKKSYR